MTYNQLIDDDLEYVKKKKHEVHVWLSEFCLISLDYSKCISFLFYKTGTHEKNSMVI